MLAHGSRDPVHHEGESMTVGPAPICGSNVAAGSHPRDQKQNKETTVEIHLAFSFSPVLAIIPSSSLTHTHNPIFFQETPPFLFSIVRYQGKKKGTGEEMNFLGLH